MYQNNRFHRGAMQHRGMGRQNGMMMGGRPGQMGRGMSPGVRRGGMFQGGYPQPQKFAGAR